MNLNKSEFIVHTKPDSNQQPEPYAYKQHTEPLEQMVLTVERGIDDLKRPNLYFLNV
jgi:hypothetical protein